MKGAMERITFQRCGNCRTEVSPTLKQCPNCRGPVGQQTSGAFEGRQVLTWRAIRYVLVVLLLLTPYLPRLLNYVRLQLDIRVSSLVSEAVVRVNSHKRATALLGNPISSGWVITGSISSDETGWTEARLWIRLSGAQNEGTLYARAGHISGPWTFSELELKLSGGEVVNLLAPEAPSGVTRLTAHGQAYLVPLGRIRSIRLEELVSYYGDKFGMHVRLLSPIAPLKAVTDQPDIG